MFGPTMAIIRFNQEKADSAGAVTAAKIRVYPKGHVRMGKAVLALLEVSSGGRVEVKWDVDSGEWYLCKSDDGLKVFSKKGQAGGSVYCKLLCQAIVDAVDSVTWEASRSFTVSKNAVHIGGTKCYAIIMSSAR